VRKIILPNGLTYIEVGEEPTFDPDYGVTQYIGDPHRFARARHDNPSRTHSEKIKLGETNETIVIRPVVDGKPRRTSQIVVSLAQRPEWVEQFKRMLGPVMWDLFHQPKFGYFDGNHELTGEIHTVLRNGGDLGKVNRIQDTFAIIEHQDFHSAPDPTVNAWNRPDIVSVQGLVGHTKERDYWKRHPKHGHLEWPFVSKLETAIELNKIEFFPELPHKGTLHGKPVLVEAYGFTGPRVFGLIEGAWKLLEEMLIIDHIPGWPRAGSDADRRVYINPWITTWPPEWCNWTRGMQTIGARYA
jgi:hypothetical protein